MSLGPCVGSMRRVRLDVPQVRPAQSSRFKTLLHGISRSIMPDHDRLFKELMESTELEGLRAAGESGGKRFDGQDEDSARGAGKGKIGMYTAAFDFKVEQSPNAGNTGFHRHISAAER